MYVAGFAAALIAAIWLAPIAAQTGTVSPAGHAQAGSRPGGRGQFGPPSGGGLALERLGRELALTDAQKTQIQALLTAQRTALKPTLEGFRQAQQQLDAAIMQIPEDDGLIQSQVAAVSTIQSEIAVARAQTEAKIYQLLTADQQQKAQQWLAQAKQR
jgi:Spy/CpxP family protein refolding chaperone